MLIRWKICLKKTYTSVCLCLCMPPLVAENYSSAMRTFEYFKNLEAQMDSEYEKRHTQATSDGFSLILWTALFRSGEMIEWPDSNLVVLPIIAAHANKKGDDGLDMN